MPSPRSVRQSYASLAAAALLLAGCGGDNPAKPEPGAPIPPIEIRSDAGTYGIVDPVDILSASVRGSVLTLQIGYSGGCEDHEFAVVASTGILASYPGQIPTFVRHIGNGDQCAAYITQTLKFDITPAIAHYLQVTGTTGPFYLRFGTGENEAIKVLVGFNPLIMRNP